MWPDQEILCPLEMWFSDLDLHESHLQIGVKMQNANLPYLQIDSISISVSP